MPSIFDPDAEAAVRGRVARLTPDAPARWGRMHAAQMLCHLVDAFRLPLGETSSPPKSTPFRFFPLRWLFVYVLPWPRGKLPTMPVFQQTQPGKWDEDRQAWEAALTRFVDSRTKARLPVEAASGLRAAPDLGVGPDGVSAH